MNKAEYIDHMGDDLRVVNAARVSFDRRSTWIEKVNESGGVVSNSLSENDQKLIKYLSRNGHWTPFSHPMITIRETVPIFVARQRFKHMVGFTYNEVSRRYVDDTPEYFIPAEWRGKPTNGAKQGSSNSLSDTRQRQCWNAYWTHHENATQLYNDLIYADVAPEQARMVLPQSMLTSYYVTGSLAAWARAYTLRSEAHAQREIRDLASQWSTMIEPLFPVSWAAMTDQNND